MEEIQPEIECLTSVEERILRRERTNWKGKFVMDEIV
jgi:hypothetical protein